MLMIRFQRIGRTNDPAFRIAVMEKERAAKTGSIVELLGTYNPRSKALTLNESRVKEWIGKGAQPTGSILNLLISKKVVEGKKVNVLPKKTPQKKEGEAVPAPEVATAPAETPEEPTEAEVAAEAEPVAEEAAPAPAESTEEAAPAAPETSAS